MKVNYNYCISIDWLTLYLEAKKPLIDLCNKKISYCELSSKQEYIYELKTASYGTKIFNYRADLWVQKGNQLFQIGTLMFSPRSSILPCYAAHFKFYNAELYTSSWMWDISFLQEVLGLYYKSISRIDLAYDFNRFFKGLLPNSLINNYLRGTILKIGNNSPTVYYKSFGYTINRPAGERDQFELKPVKQQQVEFRDKEVNAISWGTHASDVQTQLYNKSLELRHNYKRWIYEAWERVGLDPSKTWRVEIRIQGSGKDLLRFDDGTMFGLGLSDIMDQDNIERLYMTYALKYFRFVKRDYHAKKQHMQPVILFCSHLEPLAKPKFNRITVSHNRTIKIVSNMLQLLIYYIEHDIIKPTDPSLTTQYLKDIDFEIRRNFTSNEFLDRKSIAVLQMQYKDLLSRINNKEIYNSLATLFNREAFDVPSSYRNTFAEGETK